MKRIISIILALSLMCSMVGCAQNATPSSTAPEKTEATLSSTEKTEAPSEAVSSEIEESESEKAPEETIPEEEVVPEFDRLGDPALLQYVEDTVYSGLVEQFSSEDYVIENVNAIYYSKEYLEEFAYNSQCNIFFGYTLAELDEQFQGDRYVFTLSSDGTTAVEPFEDYDDTYDRVIKNVLIGSGVILVCVTVSVATGGVAAPVSMVFAASAKTGTLMALSSGTFSAVVSGTIKGIQTKDFDEAMEAAALSGSESFKWGAIFGAITGGVSELSAIRRTAKAVDGATEYAKGSVEIADDLPQWRQAELRALNEKGGYEQLSYLNGKQVEFGTPGATRPDVVNVLGDHIEAIEVKYYDLASPGSRGTLYSELEREISARVVNLPAGSTQKVVLDVTGRGFGEELINSVVNNIHTRLFDIYPNIPIEIVGL